MATSQPKTPEEESNILHHFNTKLKDIYLELPNFSFFHSPSGRYRDNPKMVGRKRIRRKLYGILTNSETKTGSYIITGFRGVGKTSLLNQVINELQPRMPMFKQALAVIVAWVLIHLLINSVEGNFDVKILLVVVFVLSSSVRRLYEFLRVFFHHLRPNLKRENTNPNGKYDRISERKRKRYFRRVLNNSIDTIISFFILDWNYFKRSISKKIQYVLVYGGIIEAMWVLTHNDSFNSFSEIYPLYWYTTFFSEIIFLLASSYLIHYERGKVLIPLLFSSIALLIIMLFFNNKEWTLIGIFVVYILIIGISLFSKFLNYSVRSNPPKFFRRELGKLLRLFKQKTNHSQKVFVRLSFPQEVVDSKDILKSVVHNMHKEYKRYRGFNYKASRLLIGIFLTTVSFHFYSSLEPKIKKEILDNSLLAYLMPSQHSYDPNSHFPDLPSNISISQYWIDNQLENESEFNDWEYQKRFTIIVDFYLLKSYQQAYDFFSPISVHFVPKYPDLVFFIFLFFIISVANLIGRYGRFFGLVTNWQIKKMLKNLSERCLAEMSLGSTMTANIPNPKFSRASIFSLNSSRNLKYPIAGARDIEHDLIHIFDEIDRIPKIFAPPEFTFIFDELDKVEPHKSNHAVFTDDSEVDLESEKVRKKREMVAGIMASMKIFFTTAKAKFIFIAGREMYDASLADSSDRESYLGSIFHDIIYVSSLYREPYDDHSYRSSKPMDITYWMERYVCQSLLPQPSKYSPTLEQYAKYVQEEILDDNDLFEGFKDKASVQQQILQKVISLVSVFINYIAFRSKGSPMNMFKLFEDFCEEFPYKNDNIFYDENKLVIGKDPKSFYLTFDYQAQYRVSFVSSIFRPFVLDTGLYLKNYSDKILVSTSYLLDHIYKYHEFGFSWRNLELLPEIIDINKAPLLRRHIEDIVSFLSDSSLKKVDNGFVNFKFHRKVIEEINYLSRRSDTESATFNFTLDESHNLKTHYRERLKKLNKGYGQDDIDSKGFINSKAFLESILGDLHFFDKEYDEAIIQYSNAIQLLRQKDRKDWTFHQTFLYMRTTLRVALIFERINTYEPAFTKYSDLIEIIRSHALVLKEAGLTDQFKRRYNEDEANLYLNTIGVNGLNNLERENFHFAKSLYENFSMMLLPILSKMVVVEKIGKQGITLKDSLRADRDFHSYLDYLKKDEKFLLKAEYHLQKGDILFYKNGYLYKTYDNIAVNSMRSYWGNKPVSRDFNAPLSSYNEYITGLSLIIKKLNNNLGKINLDDQSLSNPSIGDDIKQFTEIQKYSSFTKNVNTKIFSGEVFEYEKQLLSFLLKFLDFQKENVSILNVSHHTWHIIARLLSAFGDCLLILCDNPKIDVFNSDFRKTLFDPLLKKVKKKKRHLFVEKKLNRFGLSRTELALLYFSCSAICYKRANEVRNYSFQHKKILFTIKSFARYFNGNIDPDLLKFVKSELGPRIIEPLNQNRNLIIFPELSKGSKIKETAKKIDQNQPFNYLDQLVGDNGELETYYRFSYNTEVKMSIIHWYDLDITKFNTSSFLMGTTDIQSSLDRIPLNAYSSVNDQMVRSFELRLKSRYNRKLFLKYFIEGEVNTQDYDELNGRLFENTNGSSAIPDDDELKEIFSVTKYEGHDFVGNESAVYHLIFDSIFCELRLIEGINLSNISFIKGYFYLATAYMSLGWWAELWRNILTEPKYCQDKNRLKRKLENLIGSHEIHYIYHPEYAYQKALNNYYKCINMHSEGEAYKAILSNMYFTEGDFNDDNQHFCATMERWLINNNIVRRRIMFLQRKIKENSIFRPN